MIVPSIDIAGGRTVQLIGGREQALDAGDPRPWLERLSVVGEVAIVDLDAALGRGSNRAQIEELCRLAPCRVGGGIRDYEAACAWLDAGAARIVIGTAADPDLLRRLPAERMIVALDCENGEIVTHGWRTNTGRRVEDRMHELRGLVGGFLVTFVEREGRLGGTDLDQARAIVEAAGSARVTIAGGVTTPDEIAALDLLGADAQVGMAIYTGRMTLGDAFVAPLVSDRADGLIATVVADTRGTALGLAWSSKSSLAEAINKRRGIYESRSRGRWVKGETTGATQVLLGVAADCDRDAVRFTVRQEGTGFCHTGSASCWGPLSGLGALVRTLEARTHDATSGSYTARLVADPALLASKLREEAAELVEAESRDEVTREAADLIYFTLVRAVGAGATLDDIEGDLDRRSRRVTRRAGLAKDSTEMSR
jgi:phosphoribosyl-ATP pyrophosphohydrolase/phosphoribosyl-AMP cyclohydrolase